MKLIQAFRASATLACLAATVLAAPDPALAAQRAFFVLQSPSTETVPANVATNIAVTLIYSNASGTINNAVFTNGVSVSPSGPGVTASLSSVYAGPINSGGGTTNLTLTISAASGAPANTSYQIVVSATNNSFTANVPSGIATVTNTLVVGPPANSNGFTIALSPAAASCRAGTATDFTSTVTLVDYSATLSGTITNGVTVNGPDPANVTASLDNPYAALTNNFGQTNLTLSIHVNPSAAGGTYTITVCGTNSAFTANPTPGVASAAFTLNLTLLRQFTVSLDPAAETFTEGDAGTVIVAVTLTNLSDALAETITNSVTVSGPDTTDITAGLSSTFAAPPAGGGTASLTLYITNNGSATPGTYQVIVTASNSDFTDNRPIPGIASAINTFVVQAPPPSIQSFSVNGAAVTFTGTNCPANAQCVVLASTNVALPLANWTAISTNTVGGSGGFNVTIPMSSTLDADAAQQFFRLSFSSPGTAVATPMFSPLAGPYYADTPVTITSATAGATIRYTTDGSTPSDTYGTLYTGPVTMQQAINTNMTGFVTNCSGVTMLKAVAYKGGLADSAVFTGNYIIIVPLRYPQTPSLILGLAHMAYNVSSQNWNSVLGLWTSYLGYDAVVSSNGFALVKINDQQFIELYQRPIAAPQYQLANYGFYVSDAEAFRQQLAAAGVTVPPGVTTNALGNLSFLTVDPDGHTNEWVEYLLGSVTGQSLGQHMPGTQLFGYLEDYGDATADVTAADNYYDQCGFSGTGSKVYLPNNNCYIEMLTYSSLTQELAGKHEKAQLVTFRGTDVLTAANILQARDPSIPQTRSTEGGGDFPTHNCVDVYNADLSRVRMIDINY